MVRKTIALAVDLFAVVAVFGIMYASMWAILYGMVSGSLATGGAGFLGFYGLIGLIGVLG